MNRRALLSSVVVAVAAALKQFYLPEPVPAVDVGRWIEIVEGGGGKGGGPPRVRVIRIFRDGQLL